MIPSSEQLPCQVEFTQRSFESYWPRRTLLSRTPLGAAKIRTSLSLTVAAWTALLAAPKRLAAK